MKKEYTKIEIEVVQFNLSDVVTASVVTNVSGEPGTEEDLPV